MQALTGRGNLAYPAPTPEGGDYFHYARRGAYAAFVDGSVHFLPEDISPDDLRALLTGDAARTIDLEVLCGRGSTGRTLSD